MPKVVFGNHSSVVVSHTDRDTIRRFYCDVLGGEITKSEPERDFVRLGENFYTAFLYDDIPDAESASALSRTARTIWLEIKSDDVDEMRKRIVDSGLVRVLELPDPHLYFQAPGGQCMRLVGIDEDLSFYEGTGEGSHVRNMKNTVKSLAAN